MSTNWSGYRGKHLDFAFFKGGGRMEYLVAAVLGIVIIGAAYLTIRQFFGDDTPSVSDKLNYKCEKCGFEFTKKLSEMPMVRNPGDQISAMKLDCPSCKAKGTCLREMECPNCHKLFIGASEKAMIARFQSGRGSGPEPHDVCPFCKTDVQEWWKQHPRK
jgi:hypothetical protein